jgi:hypothetical protein
MTMMIMTITTTITEAVIQDTEAVLLGICRMISSMMFLEVSQTHIGTLTKIE